MTPPRPDQPPLVRSIVRSALHRGIARADCVAIEQSPPRRAFRPAPCAANRARPSSVPFPCKTSPQNQARGLVLRGRLARSTAAALNRRPEWARQRALTPVCSPAARRFRQRRARRSRSVRSPRDSFGRRARRSQSGTDFSGSPLPVLFRMLNRRKESLSHIFLRDDGVRPYFVR